MSSQTYKTHQGTLRKTSGVALEECVQHLRHIVIMNGHEVKVVFKRNFKNLMVK